jgi:hypothetical protein
MSEEEEKKKSKFVTCINAVAMKVCMAAVDTLSGIIFIKPKDINFSSGTPAKPPQES